MDKQFFTDALRINQIIKANLWHYAKSMPEYPHFYCLRQGSEKKGTYPVPEKDFEFFVLFIRKYGYKRKFKKSVYITMNINGFQYWTMGAKLDITILINRATIDYETPYNEIAKVYDELFIDEESELETAGVISHLHPHIECKRILDIGCGTGLFLDKCFIRPDHYIGIDPSKVMLEKLIAKQPDFKESVINTTFEDFYDDNIDLVISLFGSINYVCPDVMKKLNWMINKGGKYFLMYYKSDYCPVTYVKTGIEVEHFNPKIKAHRLIEFNNFIIATNL